MLLKQSQYTKLNCGAYIKPLKIDLVVLLVPCSKITYTMYVTGMCMPHTETSTFGNVSAMKSEKKYYDTHLISWRVCTINWKSELFAFQQVHCCYIHHGHD